MTKQYRASAFTFATALLFLCVSSSLCRAAIFTDDFESGTLSNWTIGGRQEGTNVANVVTHRGSKMAHLYHAGFTEVYAYKAFTYVPGMLFEFDLETSVYSDSPPASNYYGLAEVWFDFRDSGGSLGRVKYGTATTNYPVTEASQSPTLSYNPVAENVMSHYRLSVSDMLPQITIDESRISTVTMVMETYSSTWPYPSVTAELWVDNVNVGVTPEPSSMLALLTGLGSLAGFALIRRK